jgi:hypothetical protein
MKKYYAIINGSKLAMTSIYLEQAKEEIRMVAKNLALVPVSDSVVLVEKAKNGATKNYTIELW